jgi:hypothetical protein
MEAGPGLPRDAPSTFKINLAGKFHLFLSTTLPYSSPVEGEEFRSNLTGLDRLVYIGFYCPEV